MKMELDEAADEFLNELGIRNFRCLACEIEFSAEEESGCPKCGSEDIDAL